MDRSAASELVSVPVCAFCLPDSPHPCHNITYGHELWIGLGLVQTVEMRFLRRVARSWMIWQSFGVKQLVLQICSWGGLGTFQGCALVGFRLERLKGKTVQFHSLKGTLVCLSETVVAESVVVIKKLLQTQPLQHSDIIKHMAALFDSITVSRTHASKTQTHTQKLSCD